MSQDIVFPVYFLVNQIEYVGQYLIRGSGNRIPIAATDFDRARLSFLLVGVVCLVCWGTLLLVK